MSKKIPTVSDRSTKSVILAAHKTALASLAELEKNPRTIIQAQKNKEVIASVSNMTVESVVEDLAKTKLLVGSTLSDLEGKLIAKKTKLEDLQAAIAAEESNLKDVHDITRQADSFAALVQGQRDQRSSFESDIAEARVKWAKENQTQKETFNMSNRALQEQLNRNSEQFQYKQNKIEAESLDSFEVDKKIRLRDLADHEATVIKSLKEREQAIKAQEAEFASLQVQVENFPSVLAENVATATEDAKSRASKSHGFAERAIKKDMESASALSEQQISNLESQVGALTSERDTLRSSVEKSQAEVKSIATEAIKGAQTQNYYTAESKKA